METRNAADSSRAEQGNDDDLLSELDWRSLPSATLPQRELRTDNGRPSSRLPIRKDLFQVHADGWRIKSVDKLPLAARPDPAFRRFSPIASGLLMFDDLGNAKSFPESEAAVLRYDREGHLAAKAGFEHNLYRLGLHPHGREFIAMSSACVLQAYDEDLRLLWRSRLVDAPPIQTICRRFTVGDEWLKNYVRCVALSRDRSRYLFTAADELWCVDLKGGVLWGLRLPRRDECRLKINPIVSAGIFRALTVLGLRIPTTPREIQEHYRELAMRWHSDHNSNVEAHLQMTALNSAVELLRDVDPAMLTGENGSFGKIGVTFGFGAGFDADWIYAADFAANINAVYLGSYSGRIAVLDHTGQARQFYQVGVPPRRIVDTGDFLYILANAG